MAENRGNGEKRDRVQTSFRGPREARKKRD
jgi:hypothetical protein